MKKIVEFFKKSISVLLLIIILSSALYIRIYRIDDLMGFYYDQGRDALVIWKLWHEGKFFLIGPVTGLSGIFLGPFYYYLIAPLYLIGGGNPLVPSIFLAFISVFALAFVYLTGKEMHSRTAGLLAALIGSFSYYIIYNSRWLSNPNPMFLLSMLILYSMWKIISMGDRKWWIFCSLMIGVSLHFESASAFFYLPVFFIFILWRLFRYFGIKNVFNSLLLKTFFKKNYKFIAYILIAFVVTLIPQILFNIRHENILFANFTDLFTKDKAFGKPLTKYILELRIDYFWSAFMGKIFLGWHKHSVVFASLSLASLIFARKKMASGISILFMIFLFTPMIGYVLFQGNFGNIYDYYLIGYFLPFILIFSIGLAEFSKTLPGKISLVFFLISFFKVNMIPIRGMMENPMNGPTDIKFGSQLKAVNWVFENAAGRGVYNVDVYVPPVIPYAYDYLFLWQGTKKCGSNLCGKVEHRADILYTIYEQDPPNPHRLEAWLERQKGIAVVEEETQFGGITVQRRTRL